MYVSSSSCGAVSKCCPSLRALMCTSSCVVSLGLNSSIIVCRKDLTGMSAQYFAKELLPSSRQLLTWPSVQSSDVRPWCQSRVDANGIGLNDAPRCFGLHLNGEFDFEKLGIDSAFRWTEMVATSTICHDLNPCDFLKTLDSSDCVDLDGRDLEELGLIRHHCS